MELNFPGSAFRVLALSLLLLPSACGQEPAPEETAPDGIIREMTSGSSITTDVNARSPAFVRTDSTGRTIRTQDFIGEKVILLDFWSVFCQSCLEEIPFLKELDERYRDEGLQILSVNTDFFPQARIERFMEKTELELPFPLILDRDQSLSELFQVDALPVTVLIDSAGWIRMVHLGYRPSDRSRIESRVKKACRKIRETVVTLQPVEGKTAFRPPAVQSSLLSAGSAVPDFELFRPGGEALSFSSLREGSPAMIFFWSLFCQPCREEFPNLRKLANQYSPQGLRSVAVNVDSVKLKPAAEKFQKKEGKGLVNLFDPDRGEEEASASRVLGVQFTPSLLLVDADGAVAYSAAGEIPPGILEKQIAELFAAPSATGDGGSGGSGEAK